MKKRKNRSTNRQFAGILAFILLFAAGISFTTCHNDIMYDWWYGGQNTPPPGPVEPETNNSGGSGVNFGVVRFVLGFEPDLTQGEGPQPKEINVVWGDVVGRLRPITRINYGFEGWLDENGDSWDVETTKVVKNIDPDNYAKADKDRDGFITLTARWNQEVRSVSFNSGEFANSIPDQKVAKGGKAVQPVTPMPTNEKGFAGWWTKDGTIYDPSTGAIVSYDGDWGEQWDFSKPVTDNMTLYAKWADEFWFVDFEANGGTRPDGVTKLTHTQSVARGGKIQDPGPLKKFDSNGKSSHTFAGWYEDPTFLTGSPWNFSSDPVLHDMTLYAKWDINEYTVTFVTPDSVGPIEDKEVKHGDLITNPFVDEPGKLPSGYEDGGWWTKDGSEDGDWGTQWNIGDEVTGNLKLYPRLVHTVTFVPYESLDFTSKPATPATSSAAIDHGAIIKTGQKPTDPVNPDKDYGDNRDFAGWWTRDGRADGNWGVKWDFTTGAVTENFTLYGRFMILNRTVIFMPNGGSMPRTTYSVAIDSKITNPGNPAKPNCAFLGWYTSPIFASGTKVNFTTYKVPEPDLLDGMDNLYLYANWSFRIIGFTVYDEDGKIFHDEVQSFYYGDRILKTPTPDIPANYQLDGWYREDGKKLGSWESIPKWNDTDMVTDDGDLYARLVEAKYTVSFSYVGSAPGNFPDAEDLKQYVIEDGYVTEPFMPASEDPTHNFVRWDYSTDKSGTPSTFAEWKFNTMTVDNTNTVGDELTLYARWIGPDTVAAGIDMVWVPRGSFVYGDSSMSGKTEYYNAYPSQIRTLNGFFISETEITQAQYGSNPGKFTGANLPVDSVTFTDAETYAGTKGCRLPTEEEWEYAAKGGYHGLLWFQDGDYDTYEYKVYSGSNKASEVAWFNETVKSRPVIGTQPVKGKLSVTSDLLYPGYDLGIYDMSGNVAEWCVNSQPYPDGKQAIRGGSWCSAEGNVRSAMRNSQNPATASWDVGFRIVRTPAEIEFD